MRITAVDEELFSNNDEGTGFGVKMGSKLFAVLTESLYKDKPRAVCRETIANCVDAHRMRDALFSGLTPEDQGWKDLVASGYATPGTPYHIHVPTDIEPWLEFEDFGVGLSVEKVLGEIQYVVDPSDTESPPKIKRDGQGHPIRQDGVYTTLFGSDKEDNADAIGAYGLGCKSPFAIVDTFLVKSRVNGEEHQYLMYLNSKREPQVDWLTKDPVTGEPAPVKTDAKNGLCVRLDAIPVTMKNKITVSVSDILQTFKEEEQPVVNGGMFKYKPVEYRDFIGGLRIVEEFHYGHVFQNSFVVNTGGIIYPIDLSKLHEIIGFGSIELMRRFAQQKCIVLEMPLGTVNIPPSREEISYDDITLGNITNALTPAVEHINKLKSDIINSLELNLSSLWKTRFELQKLEPEKYSEIIREKWDSLIEERKQAGKDSGFVLHYNDHGFKAYAQIREELGWVTPIRDFRIYRDKFFGLNAENIDDYILSGYYKKRICSESHILIEISEMSDRKGIAILNDTEFGRTTVLSRLKKLRDEDLKTLFDGLVASENCKPEIVVMIGPSSKDVEVGFEDYVKFTEHLCKVGGFNYVLGSEVCSTYEKMPRNKAMASRTEIERNLSAIQVSHLGSGFVEIQAPVDIFDDEIERDVTYALREEESLLEKIDFKKDFVEYAKVRGLLGDISVVVNGVRTESRRACDSLPNFRRMDIDALLHAQQEYRLFKLQTSLNSACGRDVVAEFGLKTILGAFLFSDFLYRQPEYYGVLHFLKRLQVFVNRHPLLSFEENDLAFRHYGPFKLGDLYTKLVIFSKILGPSSRVGHRVSSKVGSRRARIQPSKMNLSALEEYLDRQVTSNIEISRAQFIKELSDLNVLPWKEDMLLLQQLEAVLSEEKFRSFHCGVFPSFRLKRGTIEEGRTITKKLHSMRENLEGMLNEFQGFVSETSQTLDQTFNPLLVAERFTKGIMASLVVCELGKPDFIPLKETKKHFQQKE